MTLEDMVLGWNEAWFWKCRTKKTSWPEPIRKDFPAVGIFGQNPETWVGCKEGGQGCSKHSEKRVNIETERLQWIWVAQNSEDCLTMSRKGAWEPDN